MASKSGIEAGRAFVRMFLNDVELQAGLKTTTQKLTAMGNALGDLSAKFGRLGIAASLPFIAALAMFIPFSDQMKTVGAVSGAAAAELEMLETKAKDLGRTTSFTATQVAAMMTELGRAGFSSVEIDNMIASVLNLSRASGTEAALAAGIMAATIRQFSLDATDATRVADVLTYTANKTFNSVESLGEALKYAGPVAAQLGMSLEDTVAILGTLGNVGIQGSEAGTALRRLATLSAAEAQRMQAIFGVAFQDAAGNARPLVDVLGEVATATENMASGERTAKFNEAFGLLGITSAQVIAGVAADTKKLKAELDSLNGVAADTAAEMDSGIGGSFRIFMSAVEGVAIAVSEAVEGPLMAWAQTFTELAGITTHLVSQNQWLVQILAYVGPVALTIAGALIAVSTAVKVVSLAMGIYQAATKAAAASQAILLALTGPKGWAILAGAAVVAAGAVYSVSKAMDASAQEAAKTSVANEKAAADLQKVQAASAAVKPPNLAPPAGAKDALTRFQGYLAATETPAEKLRKKLQELDTTIQQLGQSVPPDLQAKLKLQIIEESTGAVSDIRKLQDEIAVLSGRATEAQIDLRDMAAAGVPPELLQRYQQLRTERDRIKAEMEAQEQAEKAAKQAAEDKFADLQRQADELKEQTATKEERIQVELANLEELRKALDPATNAPLINEETYRRALERIHKQQLKEADRTTRSPSFSQGDLRSVEGSKFLVDLINGQNSTDAKQLEAMMTAAKNTGDLVTITRTKNTIKLAKLK
jgi:TP901 family phage tail tape measure protein